MRIVLYLVPVVLTVYCLIEAISSRDDEVRHLPKLGWILLVLFFPFVGSIAWLVAGRPQRRPRPRGPHEGSARAFPEYDRPGRYAASDPAADEAFLKRVRERAEDQRRIAREQKEREAAAEEAAEEAARPVTPPDAEAGSGEEPDRA
ncbi:PLD nuclease N-terminal domain-containing protein [Nocardioides sp. zg-1228]|uniref:PLD nuclease N-terminal domain-containing protein n=1 Tax=Nocardioides sp. zg-1228 TaxID=2763008 RepID=UPI001642D8B3|nr:PLD nuclease N-terminal domain-containing protein [Nocardioides sp. zg-1228]MBC2932897.1 PLDc_N domain-containing protein [Nocardioides sp. zg-1228]QSF56896.1 PLDc_N domain-containing protein [Nocardioides sp. zg-1228]